jgi:hypothetical protein
MRGERGGEIDGGGRLADSALLVGDRNDSSHDSPSPGKLLSPGRSSGTVEA